MPDPTCGRCFFWLDGTCNSDGRFDLSGPRRSPDSTLCKNYCSRRLDDRIYTSKDQPKVFDILFATGDEVSPEEYLTADPFSPEQAREIRSLLACVAMCTGASQAAVAESFERIRKAADTARFRRNCARAHGLPKPKKYQLHTELKRVGERGRLTRKPHRHVVNALLYGVHADGFLDVPDDAIDGDLTAYPNNGLTLLIQRPY